MIYIVIITAIAVLAGFAAWYWDDIPKIKAYVWAWFGNSKTIAAAAFVELLALLDEFKVIDWSALLGTERGGRVASILGIVMIVMRLVTNKATSFKPQETA